MREQELIVYTDINREEILSDMVFLMENYRDKARDVKELQALFYKCMHGLLSLAGRYGFEGNLWHCYLTNLLVNCENTYSLATENIGKVSGTVNEACLADIKIIKEFYDYDFTEIVTDLSIENFNVITDYVSSPGERIMYNTRISGRIKELSVLFNKADSAEAMKDMLTEFYKEYGVGKFGLHKAFRIEEKDGVEIVPIANIRHVNLEDLIGYEDAKKKLVENTEAFVSGRPCNNCLLYGDSGTGKSSCIKAIANKYFDRGLRVIEIYKHQFKDINDVISQIKTRNYRFILYMDDLSFEDFETEYKYLKAVIEGGLERKPENLLIYATSNRRHLINEKFSERGDDEVHLRDTMQEKLSLYDRFGVTIPFVAPSAREFHEIVLGLAKKNGINIDEKELCLMADRFELMGGGRSGRTAEQFILNLLGNMNA